MMMMMMLMMMMMTTTTIISHEMREDGGDLYDAYGFDSNVVKYFDCDDEDDDDDS